MTALWQGRDAVVVFTRDNYQLRRDADETPQRIEMHPERYARHLFAFHPSRMQIKNLSGWTL